MMKKAALAVLVGILIGCATKPSVVPVDQAMVPGPMPELDDDLNFQGLEQSLLEHIKYFERRDPKELLQFGKAQITVEAYLAALRTILQAVPKSDDQGGRERFWAKMQSEFQCWHVNGDGRRGEAFITSYFDPVIKASRHPTAEHSRPIYMAPKNMVLIRLDEFSRIFPHWSIFNMTEQKSSTPLARGRIYRRNGVDFVVPYYSRFELDQLGMARDPAIEIAYADPIDVFIMQIQGSGTLQFSDGNIERVGYVAQNGYPYVPIGRFMKDKIPPEQMSLQAIERVLRSLPKQEAQAIMDINPSYVFFRPLKGEPQTTLGTSVRPGRTIATDRQYFPKGTLALLQFSKPVFATPQDEQPSSWQPATRIVVDQDTGGAIRGTGRLDLYWGRGDLAKQNAGVMKQWGRLCYLVPKS